MSRMQIGCGCFQQNKMMSASSWALALHSATHEN
jgi:hypothetical protein